MVIPILPIIIAVLLVVAILIIAPRIPAPWSYVVYGLLIIVLFVALFATLGEGHVRFTGLAPAHLLLG